MTGRCQATIVLLLTALALSCDAATGGREVRYELETSSTSTPAFRTSAGWDVSLHEACISIGPVYVYAGEQTARSTLYDWLIPSAHAHPGVDHFAGGEARGEWLSTIAVDALAGPVGLGRLTGPAGAARTVSLSINPPQPTTLGSTRCLRGHQAYVVGVASRGDQTVAFEGALDIELEGNRRRIQVPVEVDIDDGLTLSIIVDPRPWLDEVKFEELTSATPGGPVLITPTSQARAAWFLGVQRAQAFSVRITNRRN